MARTSHLPIGMGTIDFKSCIEALKGIGWDGYLVPEIFYKKNFGTGWSTKVLRILLRLLAYECDFDARVLLGRNVIRGS